MGLIKNKKFARRLSIIFAGTLLFTTVLHGASLTKKIDATFRDIKVYYNNQQKTMAQEPFIYNNSVYLPVRAVSELVGKDVQWDSAKNGVYVSDNGTSTAPNTLVEQLQSEVASKNFEIVKINAEKAVLESKIKELEANVKDSGTSGDLKETLRYLEDKFDFEYYIDWDFKLSETSSRINVEVRFDSRTDGRYWDGMTLREQENLFRDICRQIRYDHKDIIINGKVIDSRTDKTVGTFDYSRSDSFSYKQEGSALFYDLERDLTKVYKDIDGIVDVDEIILKGDEDSIVFTVVVNLKSGVSRAAWDTLEREELYEKNNPLTTFMKDVEEAIEYDFRYARVDGYIEDSSSRNQIIASYERGYLTSPRR